MLGAAGAGAAQAAASALVDDGLQINERKLDTDLAAAETRGAVKDVILNEAVSILSDSVALKQGKSRVAADESSTRPLVVMAVSAASPGQSGLIGRRPGTDGLAPWLPSARKRPFNPGCHSLRPKSSQPRQEFPDRTPSAATA